MKEFIEFIAKHLVDKPEAVRVEEIVEDENRVKYILHVEDSETGKVIGKLGRTAKAIRTLLSAVASKQEKELSWKFPIRLKGKIETE